MDWVIVVEVIYTTAWSLSFYGQIYDNYKLKNVEGFSLNYLVLNINGYILYSIYSSVGYFTTIKGAGTVTISDLVFVYHAIFAIIIQTIQCFIYPRGSNHVSIYSQIIIGVIWLVVVFEFVMTVVAGVFSWSQFWNPLSVMGYGKLVISIIKYSPAVYWNYKRKSTKGWSIVNIILDLLGGSFSLLGGWLASQDGLNATKLILGLLTIVYDLIFIFQHYVLYRQKYKSKQGSVLSSSQNLVDSIIIPQKAPWQQQKQS